MLSILLCVSFFYTKPLRAATKNLAQYCGLALAVRETINQAALLVGNSFEFKYLSGDDFRKLFSMRKKLCRYKFCASPLWSVFHKNHKNIITDPKYSWINGVEDCFIGCSFFIK